ncbi:hypothetical protein OESDEN_14376 [Oesophagostomum dentatum]|uniref:Uncharacterized protein n=1 Tax=Oesophagostomum dentatum TaxID=61180 RepID=A0A0B1SQT0_OESDE|nr:hypothetical protein OESDEN_14376 [Oesophagostomum dentatum]
MTKALAETTRKISTYPSYYPAACFELFHASTASYIVAALQLGYTYTFMQALTINSLFLQVLSPCLPLGNL